MQPSADIASGALEPVEGWFRAKGWTPFRFQRDAWVAYLAGRSGLVHAATGYGKTHAAFVGAVAEALNEGNPGGRGVRVLWVTPLRALVNDTVEALREPVAALGLDWKVETRTADTAADVRSRQRDRLPDVLVTTPESLSVLLTFANLGDQFAALRLVVVDEWHELLGTKRGTQTELALARLRGSSPRMRTWGLSATLSNQDEALSVLLGVAASTAGVLVSGDERKEVVIDALLPDAVERFPWSGHVGVGMAGAVAAELDGVGTALVFTNTRSNAEIWYRALLDERPEWAGRIAVHHGSLDRSTRRWVEAALAEGRLRCVVCTSSLDLGVDFGPVDRVFQVGSPKGIARLLQRAGRSGHRPGAVSRVTCVPTHAFELVEFAAAREAASDRRVEPRRPLPKPLDVLVQHLVTVSIGAGFEPEALLAEIRDAWAYRDLSDDEWRWALDFCRSGGETLQGYEQFRRIAPFEGRYVCASNDIARRHRMSIGTIASDASMTVHFLNGHRLGSVEESFVARLDRGDVFQFGGRVVEYVRSDGMKAFVRPSRSSKATVPRWGGGRIPLSSELSAAMRRLVDAAGRGPTDTAEVEALSPVFEIQAAWSTIPTVDELLIERAVSRDGYHLFLYPFEGRLVHEGLASVVALRLARLTPISFTLSYNDYGIEFLSSEPAPLEGGLAAGLFDAEGLAADVEEGVNGTELARRQFREIARVSGLVFPGWPGRPRGLSQVQASSGLLFDVFERHDPQNLLLVQARREVRERQLEIGRLEETLARIRASRLVIVDTPRFSPLAFPILVDRLSQNRVSSERLSARIRKMQVLLEREADRTIALQRS